MLLTCFPSFTCFSRYVDLSHNQLISLPDRGFIQQKKLVELRLTNNKIFKVRKITFVEQQTNIINIDSQVSNGTFDGLKTITILSLRKNFIEELGASVFTDLVRVEELDLGQVSLHPHHDCQVRCVSHLIILDATLVNTLSRTESEMWTRALSLVCNTSECSTWMTTTSLR